MQKIIALSIFGTLSLGILLFTMTDQAEARSKYKKAFEKEYVKAKDAHPDFVKAAKAKTGKCWVCHVNMKDLGEDGLGKHVRNNFGKALSEHIEKNEKDADKILEAIKKTITEKSNSDDDKSPTFEELIKSGKLPSDGKPDAADVEAAKKHRDEKKKKKK